MKGHRLVLLTALVLAGACGSDADDEVSPTTTEPAQVTAEEAASVVARYRSDIVELVAAEDECSDPECLDPESQFARWLPLASTVEALRNDLNKVEGLDETATELVKDTTRWLEFSIEGWEELTACRVEYPNDVSTRCAPEFRGYQASIPDIPEAFDAWEPYL